MEFKRPRKRKRGEVRFAGVDEQVPPSVSALAPESEETDPLLSSGSESGRPRKRRKKMVQFTVEPVIAPGDSKSETSSSPPASTSSDPLLRLRNLLGNLRAHQTQNAYVRSKYTVGAARTDPMDDAIESSDAELENDLQGMQLLWSHPEWFLPFVQLFRGHELVVELLTHPNVAVVALTCRLLAEITDPELVQQHENCIELSAALVHGTPLVKVIGSLLRRLERFEEAKPFYDLLNMVENLVGLIPEARDLMSSDGAVLDGVLSLVERGPGGSVSLFHYACEILSVLCVGNSAEGFRALFPDSPRADRLLRCIQLVLGMLKGGSLTGVDEMDMDESLRNLMSVVSALLMDRSSLAGFCEIEGIEKLVRLGRKSRIARPLVMKALDAAMILDPQCCRRFVSARGLGLLFGMLMKKRKTRLTEKQKEIDEHVVSSLMSLSKWTSMRTTTSLEENESSETHPPSGHDFKERLVKKFSEESAQKSVRLVDILRHYVKDVSQFDEAVASGAFQRSLLEIEVVPAAEMEDRIFLARLEKGLMIILHCAVLLSFAGASDESVRPILTEILDRFSMGKDGLFSFVDAYAETVNDIQEMRWCENLKRSWED